MDYREAVGLAKSRPLAAPAVSTAIAQRQRAAYETSPAFRERFAAGQQLARSGLLTGYSIKANTHRRPETNAIAQGALRKGRETISARRATARQAQMAQIGMATVEEYLRTAYAAGASLENLAHTTRLGRTQLRNAMIAAGITIRPAGTNSLEGKRARARRADTAAAAKVGTPDLVIWLTEQRTNGATLTQLAAAVGHSSHWVRWRLERADLPTPTAKGASQPLDR